MQEINKKVIVKYRDNNGDMHEVKGMLTCRYQESGAWFVHVEAGDTLLDLPESCIIACAFLPLEEA